MKGLSRKGRPPKVTALSDHRYALTIRGEELKFRHNLKGFSLITKDTQLTKDDIEYAISVLTKEVYNNGV